MTDFASFAASHGLVIQDLRADGRIHRVPTVDHPRKKNGAYKLADGWGWVQSWAEHESPILWRATGVCEAVVRREMRREIEHEARRREQAASTAASIVRRCTFDLHPYLVRKGFEGERGLIDTDGRLVIPMRDVVRYSRINSVQWIDAEGAKKFLPGGQAKGSVFMLGEGADAVLCEGFATGLSIRAALASLYRSARVVVCFSAGNLAHVAGLLRGRRFIVGDNDASGTGERYAAATGLPWAMPPDVGDDANDMAARYGVRALAELLRTLMR